MTALAGRVGRRPAPRVLTPAERRILHAVWSLGRVPGGPLAALACPGQSAAVVRARLSGLARGGLLVRRWVPDEVCGDWFYELGRRGVRSDAGFAGGWRPPLAQAAHTAAVGASLVGLLAGVPGWAVESWQGEAQLRGWARPGEPFPDARLVFAAAGVRVAVLLEVDLGTESRAAWRTKLGRYLAYPLPGVLLAVTTTPARARRLAAEAGALGVPMCATTLERVGAAPTTAAICPPARGGHIGSGQLGSGQIGRGGSAAPPDAGPGELSVCAPFDRGEAALGAVLTAHRSIRGAHRLVAGRTLEELR